MKSLSTRAAKSLAYPAWRSLASASVLLAVFANLQAFAQQPVEQTAPRVQSDHQRREQIQQQARAMSIGELLELARDSLESDDVGVLSWVVRPELQRRILGQEDTQAILEIVRRGDESEFMRAFIIGVLRSRIATLKPENLRTLWTDSTQIGLDSPELSSALRVPAVLCANDLAVTFPPPGVLTVSQIEQYGRRLDGLMMSAAEDHYLRRAAIRGLVQLQCTGAATHLLALIEQETIASDPVMARSISIALADLGVTEAVGKLGELLENTKDPGIFASAACALGDLGTNEALRLLVANTGRQDDGSCGVAIARQQRLILSLLDNESPYLLPAINATKYLYTEEDTAAYKAKLIELLPLLQDDLQIAAALNRLCEVASKSECSSIVEMVPRRAGYAERWDAVYRRSIAVQLTPARSQVRVEED